jgi:putative hydrolase of the HAD superfamily
VKYRAVVFDLWNTLALWSMDNSYVLMADHAGVEHERFSEAWSALYELRATGPLEPTVRSVCEQLQVSDELVEGLMSVRLEITRKTLVPREGAVEVLDELRRQGFRLGLISVCSEEVPRLWGETELASRIDEPVFCARWEWPSRTRASTGSRPSAWESRPATASSSTTSRTSSKERSRPGWTRW